VTSVPFHRTRAINDMSLGFRMMLSLKVSKIAIGCLLVASCGCGASEDKRMMVYPAVGTVTVKGKPAEGAQVVFFAADESLRGPDHPLPTGVAGPDGKFKLSSYGVNDGAPAGEYLVTVVWPEPAKGGDAETEAQPAGDRLKSRYAAPSPSGLKATVSASPTELAPFELQ
jgi:hypothetical protein